jgi:predicted Zn-dependent protease with MMP-like domain
VSDDSTPEPPAPDERPSPDEPAEAPEAPDHPDPAEPVGVEMSEEDFDRAVADALDSIPPALAQRLSNVAVFVEEEYEPEPWEDPDTELLGLYDGIPLTERAGMPFQLPDRIVVFRGPLLRHCTTREELVDEITVTVVHEVAHFFGIGDDTLHELGWG